MINLGANIDFRNIDKTNNDDLTRLFNLLSAEGFIQIPQGDTFYQASNGFKTHNGKGYYKVDERPFTHSIDRFEELAGDQRTNDDKLDQVELKAIWEKVKNNAQVRSFINIDEAGSLTIVDPLASQEEIAQLQGNQNFAGAVARLREKGKIFQIDDGAFTKREVQKIKAELGQTISKTA